MIVRNYDYYYNNKWNKKEMTRLIKIKNNRIFFTTQVEITVKTTTYIQHKDGIPL